MKVSHSGNSPVQGGEVSGSKQTGKAHHARHTREGVQPGGAAQSEAVSPEISAKGKEFARAKQVAQEAPDTREEKIAELKRRIAADGYKIDTHAVADRLVDEHLKMSGIG